MLERSFVHVLEARVLEKAPLIQVVLGPRQVGKTTGVEQLLARLKAPSHYASADDVLTSSKEWIQTQWQLALQKGPGTILVLDEIQKIHNWSETIKRLWDAQKKNALLKCILLGSSSLSLQVGLTESLAGRFELLPVSHWSFLESQKEFHHTLDQYLVYGGYPGAEAFEKDYSRWFSYVKSSIVDRVIEQDILSQRTVSKPALFRQAFEVVCHYPAQEISYTKLLGQLQDRGNTDLVKHYLDLYEGAFLFKTFSKFSNKAVKVRASSPKIIPLCPALFTVASGEAALRSPEVKGRLFESLVGMDLNRIPNTKTYYWREEADEVDYVVTHDGALYAIEVKSGRRRSTSGLAVFQKKFPKAKTCFVSTDNYELFCKNPIEFLKTYTV